MNAKARAKFINSILDKPTNKPTDNLDGEENSTVQKIYDNVQSQNMKLGSEPVEVDAKEEAFAQGLPQWDLEPPQVAVRRIRKK